jgi:hypothetical protein
MRRMKVWMGEDNFTELEVDEMDLVDRIKSFRNKLDVKKLSDSEWSLGRIDGAKIGVDFTNREVWTIISDNKVSVNITDDEFEFINNIIIDLQNEK